MPKPLNFPTNREIADRTFFRDVMSDETTKPETCENITISLTPRMCDDDYDDERDDYASWWSR